MVKLKILVLRINHEQEQILLERAKKMGLRKSAYVRYALFKILKD